jgi:hypothetical protein
MKNKMLMKTAAFLLVFAGLTAAAFGQITISGGFALSGVDTSGSDLRGLESGVGIGGNVYLDYLLPIDIPLSLGAEIGVDTAKLESNLIGAIFDETILAVPLLARVAYHFDLMPRLDLYAVGKIGVVFGMWSGLYDDYVKNQQGKLEFPPAISFGIDAGAAYYFTPLVGVFAEAGFDRYGLAAKVTLPTYTYADTISTIKVPFNRFFTFGISTKF